MLTEFKPNNKQIVFFDGYCNLCNRTVDFILKHEKKRTLYFSSLQSGFALNTLSVRNIKPGESIIFLNREKIYTESAAALGIVKHLKWPYSLLYHFSFLPKSLRDRFYRFIAQNRYQWFGKKESCRVASPQELSRFLD